MKITILQENLHAALQQVQRIVPTKAALPILSSVLINAEAPSISIAATDLYLGIQTSVLGSIDEPGQMVVPGKALAEIVAQLSPGKITLTSDGATLILQSANGKTSLQCHPAEEFPPFPEVLGTPVSVPALAVAELLEKVSFAASQDVSRPVLTCVLVTFAAEKTAAVATDGFRLATLEMSAQTALSDQQTLLLPAKAWQEIGKSVQLTKAEQVDITVSTELKQALVMIGNTAIYARVVEGDYPPYQKIMPAEHQTQVSFDADEFIAHLKRALVFAREASYIVQLQISPTELTISANSATLGKHEGSFAIDNPQQATNSIAFNARYLQDFLAVAKGKRIWFGMNESLKPAEFRLVENQQYRYIVMPFRVTT